jgi:hypothetical protein
MSGTNEWNIHIVATNSGTKTFQPWGVGANPGDAAQAQAKQIITWGNVTADVHQPWPTVGNTEDGAPVPDADNPPGSPLYFSGPISGFGSSSPKFPVPANLPPTTPGGNPIPVVTGVTIYYCCKNHPSERGRIVIY